jgi:GMP synthase (glutamine-hydrolysing)
MPSAVVLRHVPFESLGLLGPLLQKHGYQTQIVDVPVEGIPQSTLSADLLVVLGGPIGVYEQDDYPFLTAELSLLRSRLGLRCPTLGICLGAQLVAQALGGEVHRGHGAEIGWAPLQLTEAALHSPLAGLEGANVLHWHGDTFTLPEGAVLLASTANYPHQAFSMGRHVLALQFHLEVRPADFEGWLVGHAAEIGATEGLVVRTLRDQTAKEAPRLTLVAEAAFDGWLAQLPD